MSTVRFAPARDRVAALADINRAASLQDIRLEVSVAHTKHRLRARFCVCLRRAHRTTWAFGVEIKDAKQFVGQMMHLAKNGSKGTCRGETSCPMCKHLYQELKRWPKFPAFSSVGKRHLDDKCAMLTEFFYQVFDVLSRNAQWLQSCEVLREMLRQTEEMCRIQYEHDSTTVSILASLKRVTPMIRTPLTCHTHASHGNTDCSICLSSLYEPAEATTANATDAGPNTTTVSTRQPTQGVELPCGHRFHDSCISLWFHSRLNCPVCRQEPTTSQHEE